MTRSKVTVSQFGLSKVWLYFFGVAVIVLFGFLFCAMLHVPDSVRLEDIMQADFKPPPGQSIFFHETQSRHAPRYGSSLVLNLTTRQACAIESAALHNPSHSIFVTFVSPIHRNMITTEPVMEAVRSYSNVHLRTLNLWTYATNTPTYRWLMEGKLFTSGYLIEHTSDFLRYLTLWRWGGIYLDLDVVVLRSMEELPPNYTGFESEEHLGAGIMNMAHNGFGHDVASLCLQNFQRNFDGGSWSNSSVGVITAVMQSVCGPDNINLTVNSNCMGFRLFGIKYFYAIGLWNWEYFIEPQYLEDALSLLRDSYVAHMWNKITAGKRIKVGSNAAYEKLAEKHCPKVYATAGEYF